MTEWRRYHREPLPAGNPQLHARRRRRGASRPSEDYCGEDNDHSLTVTVTVAIDCPRCQVAPYFAGSGGFVGESAGVDGVTEVEFFVVCGETTVSSRVQPDG